MIDQIICDVAIIKGINNAMNLVLIMIKEMIKKINKKCDLNMFMFLKKKQSIHKTNRKKIENILSIYLVYIVCATVLVHAQLRQVFHGAQSHKVLRNTFLCLLVLQVKRSLQTMGPITKVITPTPRVIPTPVEEVRPSLLDVFFPL